MRVDREALRALLAQNIKALAGKRGMTLSEVAREAGLAKSSFFAIVHGKSSPTADTILLIADVLRTAPWRLLKPAREKPRRPG